MQTPAFHAGAIADELVNSKPNTGLSGRNYRLLSVVLLCVVLPPGPVTVVELSVFFSPGGFTMVVLFSVFFSPGGLMIVVFDSAGGVLIRASQAPRTEAIAARSKRQESCFKTAGDRSGRIFIGV
jgi:hypothetical protein